MLISRPLLYHDPSTIRRYTFALMVAGLMVMIRKSGGISAVAQRVGLMSGSIIGQLVVLGAGIVLFFDPYASIIFVGETISPYFRLFPVSLEKYSFLIQSTGVPVSTINPFSTSPLLKEQQEAILAEKDDKKAVIDTDSGSISELEIVSADFERGELNGLVRKASGNSVHT